jgi:hypothetical protein
MSRAILSIALCFSVLGMTVIPSGYMPCCCKGARHALKANADDASPCRVAVKTEETGEKHRSHRSCCATPKETPQETCCGHKQAQQHRAMGKVISSPCHKCRCIEEMQIVAIPGVALSEKSYRLSELAIPVAEILTITPVERWIATLQECASPGIVITLQTCSFRC